MSKTTRTGGSSNPDAATDRLALGDVRRIFRLVGEIRELGAEPEKWRPHMVLAMRKLMGAEVVVSSEIHFHKVKSTGAMKVFDIGWGCDPEGKVWKIHTEREDEKPENFWVAAASGAGATPAGQGVNGQKGADDEELVPVKPTEKVRAGRYL